MACYPRLKRSAGGAEHKRAIDRHFVDQQSFPASANRDQLTAAIYDEFTARIIEVYQTVPAITGAEAAILQLRQRGYLVASTTGFDRASRCPSFAASVGRACSPPRSAATTWSKDGRLPLCLFHAMEEARVNSVAEVWRWAIPRSIYRLERMPACTA
jgi:hypothetical protein